MTAAPETTTPELLYLLLGDPPEFHAALAGMRAADIADAVLHLPPEHASRVVAALPFELAVQVLDVPELEHHRCGILQHMDEAAAAPLIEAMSADQQADLFRELPARDRARILKRLTDPTRDTLRRLLAYSPETAGGIMTTEFVSVPANWTVAQVFDHVRAVEAAKETVYAIYILDPATQALQQAISLRALISADTALPISEAAEKRSPLCVTAGVDQEEVARMISKYNLLALPVVDADRRVIGIVTVDDVIDTLVRESTEDVQKLGGMTATDARYSETGFWAMIRKRGGWLTALFLGEMLTATAMGHFEGEIAKAVVLALFVPLIISSGGNSGGQATSLIVRALALQEITLRDWWRVAIRELPTGLMLGAILGVVGIIRIVLWQKIGWYDYGDHWLLIAATVGVSLVGVVAFGSLAGSMLPFILKRLSFDPASASAPFVATLVDVTGLVIYFTIASVILRGRLL
jgi:magnesium transporter